MRVRLIKKDDEFLISVREFPHSEPFIFKPEKIDIPQGDVLFSDYRKKAIEYYLKEKKNVESTCIK